MIAKSKKMMKISNNDDSFDCPKLIPFEMLDEQRAFKNHGQSLEKLNSRGGLCPSEAMDIIVGNHFGTTRDQAKASIFLTKCTRLLSEEEFE